MHYRVLITALKRKPFEPFNIVMSSGQKYLLAHPENLSLGKDSAVVPVYKTHPPREIADEFVFASYLHISALEPVTLPRPKARRRQS